MVNLKGAPGSMRTHRYLALTALLAIVVGACSSSSSPAPSAASAPPAATATPAASAAESTAPSASASAARGKPKPARAGSGRGGHPERRAERSDHVLDVLPVTDLRPVHQGHDRPLPGDVSDRHGQVGRPPGHVQGRPEQRVRREHRAGRHQPVGQRGLGQRVRGQGPAAPARHRRPEDRPGHLLPGPVEGTADQRHELPVPLVPGPQRRADQPRHL